MRESIFNSYRFFGWLAAGVLTVWITGCSSYGPTFDPRADTSAPNPLGPTSATNFVSMKVGSDVPKAWLKPSEEEFRIGPGDQLSIEVIGFTNTVSTTVVAPDGKLYYQNVSGLKVNGSTLPEVKQSLERELGKWYNSPQVSVSLTGIQSKRVWVMGRVTNPGLYVLDRPTTVLDAISLAGGLATRSSEAPNGTVITASQANEELADLTRAFLIRDRKYVPIDFGGLLRNGQMSNNVYLKDNDYIYLPGLIANEVYVLGSVTRPGAVRYIEDASLVSVIAAAGGPAAGAHIQNMVLIRGSLTQPQVAVIGYHDIVTGRARDVILHPRDIVWIPRSPWERLDRLVNDIVGSFVRTVAVNEGSRFGAPDTDPVGTTINIGPTITAP